MPGKTKVKKIRKKLVILNALQTILMFMPRAILKTASYTVDNSEIAYNPRTKDIVIRIRKEV